MAIYKATGLIKCYTLEGNYNTGRYINPLPPRGKEGISRKINSMAPKYTPAVFEDVRCFVTADHNGFTISRTKAVKFSFLISFCIQIGGSCTGPVHP